MHDWTLKAIFVDWVSGNVRLDLQSAGGGEVLEAVGLRDLRVPRQFAWGRSASVSALVGPNPRPGGLVSVTLEMQSGDEIEVVAESFTLPAISN